TSFSIDYCFCFGDHILKGDLIKRYENRIINFHPSILPNYRGRKAIDMALSDGAFVLGNTAHFINSKVDDGPIILQSVVHTNVLLDGDYDKVLDLQLPMLFQIYKWLCQHRIVIDENNKVRIIDADYSDASFYP